jgi:hypothetical protein
VLWWLVWVLPFSRGLCKRRASCGFPAVLGADVHVLEMLHVAARALLQRKGVLLCLCALLEHCHRVLQCCSLLLCRPFLVAQV